MALIPAMIHVASRPRPCHHSRHAQAPDIIPGGLATYPHRAGGGGRTFSYTVLSEVAPEAATEALPVAPPQADGDVEVVSTQAAG